MPKQRFMKPFQVVVGVFTNQKSVAMATHTEGTELNGN